MIVRKICQGLAVLTLIFSSLNAWAASYSIVCQVSPGTDINRVASALQGKVLDEVLDFTYLLSVPTMPGTNLPTGVIYCEANAKTSLPGFRGAVFSLRTGAADLWYRSQPALMLIKTDRAVAISKGRGIVIADIDSAVDYSHPALRGVLTSGKDFIAEKKLSSGTGSLNQATASFLDQSTASFLDQATASFLDQATASFLDQATASFLDQSTASFLDTHSPGHGHATMVAGILAAIASESMVMPLRAFDDSGQADASDIAKAIRYAVKNGAKVINMSFGVTSSSKTLQNAIKYAVKNNVVLVASAGNGNTDKVQYPAGYTGVIGVGATDLKDRKAYFSNFGAAVDVAAPGVNIISSYPGGHYAVLSGTSFAGPMVAAEAALLLWEKPQAAVEKPIEMSAKRLNPLYRLGAGRVNLYGALRELMK